VAKSIEVPVIEVDKEDKKEEKIKCITANYVSEKDHLGLTVDEFSVFEIKLNENLENAKSYCLKINGNPISSKKIKKSQHSLQFSASLTRKDSQVTLIGCIENQSECLKKCMPKKDNFMNALTGEENVESQDIQMLASESQLKKLNQKEKRLRRDLATMGEILGEQKREGIFKAWKLNKEMLNCSFSNKTGS